MYLLQHLVIWIPLLNGRNKILESILQRFDLVLSKLCAFTVVSEINTAAILLTEYQKEEASSRKHLDDLTGKSICKS